MIRRITAGRRCALGGNWKRSCAALAHCDPFTAFDAMCANHGSPASGTFFNCLPFIAMMHILCFFSGTRLHPTESEDWPLRSMLEVSEGHHPLKDTAKTALTSLSWSVPWHVEDFSVEDIQRILNVYGASCEHLFLRFFGLRLGSQYGPVRSGTDFCF